MRNSRKTIAELEALLRKIFTLKCFFCGKTDKQPRLGVSFHEKHGNSHDYHTVPKLRYILAHPDAFVPLCRHHHILAHRLMMEGFVWDEISDLIINKRKSIS